MGPVHGMTLSMPWLRRIAALVMLLLLGGILAGCAASRSAVTGKFDRPAEKSRPWIWCMKKRKGSRLLWPAPLFRFLRCVVMGSA